VFAVNEADEGETLLSIVRQMNPLRNPTAFPHEVTSICLAVDPRTLLALSCTSKTLRRLITRDVLLRSLLDSDDARYLPRVSEPLRAESIGAVCPMPPLRLLRLALATRCENCFVAPDRLRCFVQISVALDKAISVSAERLLVELRSSDGTPPLRRSAAALLQQRRQRDNAFLAAMKAASEPAAPAVATSASSSSSAASAASAAAAAASPSSPFVFGRESAAMLPTAHWLPERAQVSPEEEAANKLQKKLMKKWTSVDLQRYMLHCEFAETALTHTRTVETRLSLPPTGGSVSFEFRVLRVGTSDDAEPVVVGPAWRKVTLTMDPTTHRVSSPSSFLFSVSCRLECPDDAPEDSLARGKQVDSLVETASITDDTLFLCASCTKLLKGRLYPEDRHYIHAIERTLGLLGSVDVGNDMLHEALYETSAGEQVGSMFNIDVARRLKAAHKQDVARTYKGHARSCGEEQLDWYVTSVVGDHIARAGRLAHFASLRVRFPVLFGADEIAALVDSMSAKDPTARFRAVQGLRRHLSRTQRPPISEAIAYGALTPLVQFLSDEFDSSMQFEAAWNLTNVASGSHAQTMAVVTHGAHVELVRLLSSPATNVAEQAVWAVGNISGDSPGLRDMVIGIGAVAPLLRLIESTFVSGNVSLQRNGTWALSNLLRGRPAAPRAAAIEALPVVLRIVNESGDASSVTDALWALAYATDVLSDSFEPLLEQVAATIVRFVNSRGLLALENSFVVPALRAIGNMIAGCNFATQAAVDAGAIQLLLVATSHERPAICKESFWALSNICAGTLPQIQAAIDAGVLSLLKKTLKERTVSQATLKEVFWCACNIIIDGSQLQATELVNEFDGVPAFIATANAAGFFALDIAAGTLRDLYLRGFSSITALRSCVPPEHALVFQDAPNWQVIKAAKALSLPEDGARAVIALSTVPALSETNEEERFIAIHEHLAATPKADLEHTKDAKKGEGEDGDEDEGEDEE
jgi:hypothetical protein